MATYRIAVVPGDGIGHEVMAEALKVLSAVEGAFSGVQFACQEFPAGAKCCQETGTDLPDTTLAACKSADAILFGVVEIFFQTDARIHGQVDARSLPFHLHAGDDLGNEVALLIMRIEIDIVVVFEARLHPRRHSEIGPGLGRTRKEQPGQKYQLEKSAHVNLPISSDSHNIRNNPAAKPPG